MTNCPNCGHAGDHFDFSQDRFCCDDLLNDWKYEVANGDTTRSFDDWLAPAKSTDQTAISINNFVDIAHGAAAKAGWWDREMTWETVPRNLMLIVSELAEAMEGDRKKLMDDKLPTRSMLEVELADAMIRIADLAGALKLDLGGAIVEKLAYNASRVDHTREHRAGAGGKTY